MKNSMAVCEWCFPVQGPSAVALAAELGFDGLQICDLGGIERNFPLNEQRIREAYVEAAEKNQCQLQTMNLYALGKQGFMLYPSQSSQGEAARLSIENGVKACANMNVPTLFVSSFDATLIRNERDFTNFASNLKYAVKFANDYGIKISYESVLSIPRLMRMIEVVKEKFSILYDLCNPYYFGSGVPEEEIKILGKDLIDQIHVKDKTNDWQNWCLLGNGAAKLDEASVALNEIGWSGWVATENYYIFFPNSNRSMFENMKTDLDYMNHIFS